MNQFSKLTLVCLDFRLSLLGSRIGTRMKYNLNWLDPTYQEIGGEIKLLAAKFIRQESR